MAWEHLLKSKEKGGLGVQNLRLQNDARLLKQLHKFYAKADIPWVYLIWFRCYENKVPHGTREMGSFWWKDVLQLCTLYRGVARCCHVDGSIVLFWDDLWGDRILSLQYPLLHTFVKNKSSSVKNILEMPELESIFFLPLSQQAYAELQDLITTCKALISTLMSWTHGLSFGGTQQYSSRKFYALAFKHLASNL